MRNPTMIERLKSSTAALIIAPQKNTKHHTKYQICRRNPITSEQDRTQGAVRILRNYSTSSGTIQARKQQILKGITKWRYWKLEISSFPVHVPSLFFQVILVIDHFFFFIFYIEALSKMFLFSECGCRSFSIFIFSFH